MKKILFFSSIYKPKAILEIVLSSYAKLEKDDFEIDFLFYDDNEQTDASEYLNDFCQNQSNCFLMPRIQMDQSDYQDHNWNLSRIDRVITIKNNAIQYTIENNYDYLFLVDADLVLHTRTLAHLVQQKKHFIFTVFWTLFFDEPYHKPNAWDFHSWSYKGAETLLKLSEQGSYVVGGGGACTLISNEILKKGLTFERLPSLGYPGEDRHFCTRAQALGYDVMVDSHFPAYHIFLESQCNEAKKWYENGANPEFFKQWLNEEWKVKVIKSFENKDKNIMFKIKRFQYEIRKSFKRFFYP
jgi:GT2 family glycosyltransferase